MNFKYVQNYFEDDKLTDYTMNLKSPVGSNYDYGVNGSAFAEELDLIASLPEVERIHIRICSPGGSVIEGMSIITSILNCKKQVITYADGFVASIASLIFISGDITKMWDAGLLMFHGCSGGDAESLEYFNGALSTVYQKRLGKTKDEVEKWMSKDTYFTASDAKEAGIVDEVYETEFKIKYAEKELTAENVGALFNMELTNMATVDNVEIKNKTQEMELDKLIEVCNLAPEATNEEVINHIQTVQNDVANLALLKEETEALKVSVENYVLELNTVKNELEVKNEAINTLNATVNEKSLLVANLSEQVTKFEAEDTKRHELKIENLINTAIEAKKINATLKNEWTEIAKDNYERAEKLINGMVATRTRLSDVINADTTVNEGSTSFASVKKEIVAKIDNKGKSK